ncbi:hypothetical protein NKR19_g9304 [Coniochaeta hoffmannii]|uniref:N-acetyltransferase domain-containing protein n=1 Tax=Coniochaeta hoffmannii TaxID=91930 RepID=A0AA38RHW4_9PEZI|nr:hypothetical protein NKR19_g9304 [Coniochaeta hoffmannii]
MSSPQVPATSPTLPEGYRLHVGYPSVSEYCRLRRESGLTPKSEVQAVPIPQGSWYGCYISFTPASSTSSTAVAMGRIIGDGGWYFHIADMATLPGHQRKGFGKVILRELVGYIKTHAPVGEGAEPYVTLLADGPGRKLYQGFGFEETGPRTVGMALAKGWWREEVREQER